MSVNIGYGSDGGSLSFEAEIETSKFDAGVKKIESGIEALSKKQNAAGTSIGENIGKSLKDVSAQNKALLDSYAKNAREAEALWKNKQSVMQPAPIVNNLKEVAQDVLKLKGATQENNAVQEVAGEVLSGISLETFTLAGAISFATGFLVSHKKEILEWVVALFKGNDATAQATKLLKEQIAIQLASREARLKGLQAAAQESVEMKTLYKAALDLNIPLKERNKIIEELQSKYPDYFSSFSNEEILAGKAEKAYNLLTTAILAAAKARAAQDAIAENQSRILENDFTKADLATEREKARLAVKKAQENFNNADKYRDKTASSLTGATTISQASLAAGAISGAKKDLDVIDKKIRDISTDSDILNKKNAKLASDVQDNIRKNGAVAVLGINNNKPKAIKETTDKTINERKALVSRMNDIDAEYSRKSFTKDEEEVQALKDKFSKFRKIIEDFNKANPKQAIGLEGLGEIETRANSDLIYRQNTEKLKISLNEQKGIYTDFEKEKTIIGEAQAKERFSNEINTQKSYLTILQDELSNLNSKNELSGAELERKKAIEDNIKAELKIRKNAKDKEYAEAYLSAVSYGETLARIDIEYSAKAKALGKDLTDEKKNELLRQKNDAIEIANDEAYQKTEIYKRLSQETILLSREQIKEQITILKELLNSESIQPKVRNQLNSQLSGLQNRLGLGSRQSNVNALKKEQSDIEKAITLPQSQTKLKELQDRLIKVGAELKKISGNAKGADKGLSGFISKLSDNESLIDISNYAADAADGLNSMSAALGGNETAAGYALDTIGQLAGGVADLAAGLASGDPAKMIGAAIKAIGTLFSIGKKVKEMNAAARKEVADFYASAISGEREYQDLLKERALQTIRDNKVVLEGIRAEIDLRKSQVVDYNKEVNEIMAKLQGQNYTASESYTHGTWFRKASVNKTYSSLQGMDFSQLSSLLAQGKLEGDAKALVERLKELEQKGYDATAAVAELAKQTAEIFTGTSSDTLTDSLLNMFKEGKTGAQDLADFFKSTMNDAALSIFKNKVLAAGIDKFYEQFSKKAQSDDELTNTEILDLQSLFKTFTDDAQKKFEEFQKITGQSLNTTLTNSASAVTGTITSAGLTENSANIAMGIWRGQYDLTKTLVRLSGDSLTHTMAISKGVLDCYNMSVNIFTTALEIRDNTFRTANNTDNLYLILSKIEKNTSGGSSYQNLINGGIKP
ncbi:hypothetical protein ACFOWA_13220 [Pedobacter lithocola]|uniref:Uncharacterized protein n=1 Tax=Pedobacter lithocola TaxID=1908239 RepID=A0ABV8PA42_9SPHI